MQINYDDAVTFYKDYEQGKARARDYTLELSGNLVRPPALEAVRVLDRGTDLDARADFVKSLLMGNSVTVKCKDREVCSFLVNEGFQWFAVDALNKEPAALQFILAVVYGLFLKNCVPLSEG